MERRTGMVKERPAEPTVSLGNAAALAEARQFGLMYGRELASARFTVRQAIEAFTFFRRSLEETARRLAAHTNGDAQDVEDLRDQLDALNDRVLLGIAEAYDGSP